MKQFESGVNTVIEFLKFNDYSPSVISQHKQCYQDLANHFKNNHLDFSCDRALQWVESQSQNWSSRKYTGYKHCILQLNDVFSFGAISLSHLGYRDAPYGLLSTEYRIILDLFLSDTCSDDRYRIACSRFLLYLQSNNIMNLSEVDYSTIINFHNDDYHRSYKSKDVYENLIRCFLRYLAAKGICDIGFSLTLNKLLINQIITIPHEKIELAKSDSNPSYIISWDTIISFVDGMRQSRYGESVMNASVHILKLLYIFLQMHNSFLDSSLLWYWFDQVKPLLGSSWKQHRRTLCQFLEYLTKNVIVTGVTGDPKNIDVFDTFPLWMADPLNAYLILLKREGFQASTIAMQRSSNIRFCKYLLKIGVGSFSDLSQMQLNEFNIQDQHKTAEGKAAYNCRIRNFIIYLYEQKLISNPYLHLALPSFVSTRVAMVETLPKVEVATIWSVNPEFLRPKALRDYAMVCIGLSMGLRASDIVLLRFENIDWKEKSIRITQKKTGKRLVLPMPVKTGNIIFRYIRDGRPDSMSPFIFIKHEAPYESMNRSACSRALKRFLSPNSKSKFHTVRKTFATQLLNADTKIELISDSLGHTTNDTVHKYLSLNESRMRLCAISLEETGILYKGGAFHA